MKGSKAMSSIQPQLRHPVGAGPAATGIHRRNDAQKARLAEDVWKMLIHLPIIILASLHPTAIADTAPKFDIARVCQSEGGSNEEQKRCADDELNEASNQRHPA
jgi:hypothetical protein